MRTKGNSAIILAPDDKGLQPLFGVPAVRRLALLARQMGLRAVHVIGHVEPLMPLLTDLIPQNAFHAAGDPVAWDAIVAGMSLPGDERVFVFESNLVIDRHSLAWLMEAGKGTGRYIMETFQKKGQGLYLVYPSDLGALLPALWLKDASLLNLSERAQKVGGVEGLPYAIDQGTEETRISEDKLIAALSFQTAADDGFLARHFDRLISRFISSRLAHTAVTPNQVTLGGVSIGLLGAFLLSRPGYWVQLMGAFLFLFCVIVDGVDGEIARLKLKETRFGHYLDVVTDNIVHIAVFMGIAFGLFNETCDPGYLHALWFLMGGFGLCVLAVYQCILRRSPEELERSPRMIRFMSLLTNRDFAYLVFLLAAVHRLNWFLVGSAVGAYLFALTLWAMSIYKNRAMAHRIP